MRPKPTVADPDWLVVCLKCRRLKRGDVWTNERAAETAGISTGFCDACRDHLLRQGRFRMDYMQDES